MILVVGATGLVGTEVCRQLAAKGERVRGLVRETSDPGKVQGLRVIGVEPVVGDVREAASLEAACDGVDSVISTVSSMPFSYVAGVNDIEHVDRLGVTALIDAARAAGARQFVYVSFSGNIDLPCPLRDAKRDVEAHLQASGMRYTILRPSCFMEVWLGPAGGFDPLNATATIYGSGDRTVSWVALADVAGFAVRSLDTPSAWNATIEVGGPEALTALEAVEVFERIGGRPFEVTHVAEDALQEQRRTATDAMAASFATLMCCVAQGDPIPMGRTLREFPVAMTTIEDYAARVLGAVPAGVA